MKRVLIVGSLMFALVASVLAAGGKGWDQAADDREEAAYRASASASVVAETNRAQVAEAALSTRITAETNRAQVAEAALSARIDTDTNNLASTIARLRTGSCTNNQTVTFSPAYAGVPVVVGVWAGTTTDYGVTQAVLQVEDLTVNGFKFTTPAPQTNAIKWMAY